MTLVGVTDGATTSDVNIPMSVLVGDTNGNGTVTASDVALTKSQSGQSADETNFRSDVTVNGTINSSDVSLVKANSGTGSP